MYSYILKNGIILDGSGEPAEKADVAVWKDRIVKIAPDITGEAKEQIDISGKLLCPGFIDVHSHSDISILWDNNPDSKIFQGITTEVIGNCGFSPFPLIQDPHWLARRRASLAFIDVKEVQWNWRTFDQYVEEFEKKGQMPNVNLFPLAGYGSIRAVVMGYENKKASPGQIAKMCQLLEEQFAMGVCGLSAGLGYPPDFYSDEEELTELAKVVKKYDRIFAFHVRGERKTLFQAVEEVIHIGEKSGAKVHISHLKCAGIYNAERSRELLEKIDRAKKDGVDISFDMYPYTAGSSYLGLLFPPEFHEGGTKELLKKLQDPAARREIKRKMKEGTKTWSTLLGEYEGKNLRMTSLRHYKEYIGRTIWELGQIWRCSPAEAACRLMEGEGGTAEMVMELTLEEDMDRIACWPGCMYGTDGLAMGGGPVQIRDMPHPRYYGSFPTLIERYGKTGRIPLERLIHQMTGLPAKRFSIHGRGLVREGYYADLVVLDMNRVHSGAVYEMPCRNAEGIGFLMVNGCMEIRRGRKQKGTAGKMLRLY